MGPWLPEKGTNDEQRRTLETARVRNLDMSSREAIFCLTLIRCFEVRRSGLDGYQSVIFLTYPTALQARSIHLMPSADSPSDWSGKWLAGFFFHFHSGWDMHLIIHVWDNNISRISNSVIVSTRSSTGRKRKINNCSVCLLSRRINEMRAHNYQETFLIWNCKSHEEKQDKDS